MRRGEILSLKWSDVDFEERVLTIEHSSVVETVEASEMVLDATEAVN